MSLASSTPPSAVRAHAPLSLHNEDADAAPIHDTGLSLPIVPPCTARRVLPRFAAPGCHMYDPYHNCFLYRPELQRALLAAAEQAAARRRHGASREGAAWHNGDFAQQDSLHDGIRAANGVPCHCALDATQLFASTKDMPSPALPLSRCELHEVHRALPPRWQCYPWRLCFDTAVDGFSLASLYRRMEAVEAQQSQVKSVTFSLIFVHPRSDSSTSGAAAGGGDGGAAADPLPAASMRRLQEGGSGEVAAAVASNEAARSAAPVSPAASSTYRPAPVYSPLRYGTRPAPPAVTQHGVIGCFTPEVPCLGRHPANVYYGSTDTYVFRLDQLRPEAAQGAWMAADVARARDARQRHHEAAHAHQHQHEHERGSWAVSNGSIDGVRRGGDDAVNLHSPHTLTSSFGSRTEATTSSVFGYAALSSGGGGGDDGAAGVPVPLPSRAMLQPPRAEAPRRTVDRALVRPPPLFPPEEPPASATHADPSHAAPRTAAAHTPTSRDARPLRSTGATAASAAASSPSASLSGTAPPLLEPRAVPQAPLLEKYTWCGRADNRKFTVCNPHFLAIGGGKSGPAVYLEETLQYGTTSRWCETFDAPCLFGPRTRPAEDGSAAPFGLCTRGAPTDDVDAGGTPRRASADADITTRQPTTPSTAVTPLTPSALLPHKEFSISRLVWFNIIEDKRTMRTMGVPDSVLADALGADAAAAVEGQDAHVCGCGRCGFTRDAACDPALAFAHHCDLLAFATPL